MFDEQTIKSTGFSRRALNENQDVRLVRNDLVADKNNSAANPRAPIKTIVWLFGLIFVLGFRCLAQNTPPSEYQIKAAFLYNFAKFVEWPAKAFAEPTSPLVIGVLGKNVFDGDLDRAIHGKTINGHPLEFKEFHSVADATNCQILFISSSEKNHFQKILDGLHGVSVLTVSETDHFIEDGGMINLVIVEKKVRFQINNEAAKQAGLTISSKLLTLAVP